MKWFSSTYLCFLYIKLTATQQKHYSEFKDYKSKFEEMISKRNIKWNNKYLLLIIGLIITLIAAYLIPYKIIAYSPPYASLDFKLSEQLIYRVSMVLVSMIAVLALNNSMHNKNDFLTKLGKNSMAIYIFHLGNYHHFQYIFPLYFLTNYVL